MTGITPQAKHTIDLPVRLSPRGDYLKDAGNQTLADLRYHTATAEAKDFIVCAINCHAELLEALKAMVKAFHEVLPGIKYIACQDYAIVNKAPILADAAIAKAEGRP